MRCNKGKLDPFDNHHLTQSNFTFSHAKCNTTPHPYASSRLTASFLCSHSLWCSSYLHTDSAWSISSGNYLQNLLCLLSHDLQFNDICLCSKQMEALLNFWHFLPAYKLHFIAVCLCSKLAPALAALVHVLSPPWPPVYCSVDTLLSLFLHGIYVHLVIEGPNPRECQYFGKFPWSVR